MQILWGLEEHYSSVVAEEERRRYTVAGLVVAVVEVAAQGRTRCIVVDLMVAGYFQPHWQSMDLLGNLYGGVSNGWYLRKRVREF